MGATLKGDGILGERGFQPEKLECNCQQVRHLEIFGFFHNLKKEKKNGKTQKRLMDETETGHKQCICQKSSWSRGVQYIGKDTESGEHYRSLLC